MTKAVRNRVALKTRTGMIEGTVIAVEKKGTKVLGDDGGAYTAPAGYVFHPAKGETPAHLRSKVDELTAPAPKWAKGDRATITEKGTVLKGTITRGGARPTMVLDGGREQITADARAFAKGEPLPAEAPSRMDAWEVRKYAKVERMSEETTCYTADIHLDGKRVIAASNRGTGGADLYHPVGDAKYDVVDRLESDARQWFEDHDVDYGSEAAAAWIDYQVHRRPFGVTVADYMTQTRETFASFRSPSI